MMRQVGILLLIREWLRVRVPSATSVAVAQSAERLRTSPPLISCCHASLAQWQSSSLVMSRSSVRSGQEALRTTRRHGILHASNTRSQVTRELQAARVRGRTSCANLISYAHAHASLAQWQSVSLVRTRPRVRSPSEALRTTRRNGLLLPPITGRLVTWVTPAE